MRIDHILFAIDFSDSSRALNTEVEWLASRFNSRVTLLHVFEIPASWYVGGYPPLLNGDDVMAYAESEKKRLEQYIIHIPETRIERVSLKGSAASHIAEWTAKHAVDLIVMGTHGYGTFRRLLLGSVAMKVMHDVSCPVWTHSLHQEGEARTPGISNIVCAIELTDEAVPLLRFVQEVAAEFHAKVTVIHTVPEADTRSYRYFDFSLHRHLLKLAAEEVSRLQSQAGTNFPSIITESQVAQDVRQEALNRDADLVIIGRGKAKEMLGGLRTHAYGLIRQAPCPVISFSEGSHQGKAAMQGEKVSELASQ